MSYRKSSYSNDPKWIKAKFDSSCKQCNNPIKRNEDIYYFPIGKNVYCHVCGEIHSSLFESERQDEDFMNSQFPSYG